MFTISSYFRSPECETSVLFDLFDAFWVWISSVLLVGNKPTLCLGIFVKESDELLTSLGYLLRDYAEFQLPRLNDQSASKLYNAFVCLMTLYSSRLKKVTVAINKNSIEDHQLFINDSCSLLFEVMNHLSTKDLVCLDVSNVSTHTIHEVMNMKDVSDALLYGFKTLLPVLTEEMVTSYPVIAERFVSFTVFMMGSYVDTVSKWFSTLPNALHIFQHFVNLLGVGCFVPDGSTARMALQVKSISSKFSLFCHHFM